MLENFQTEENRHHNLKDIFDEGVHQQVPAHVGKTGAHAGLPGIRKHRVCI